MKSVDVRLTELLTGEPLDLRSVILTLFDEGYAFKDVMQAFSSRGHTVTKSYLITHPVITVDGISAGYFPSKQFGVTPQAPVDEFDEIEFRRKHMSPDYGDFFNVW